MTTALRQTDFLPARFSGDKLDRDDATAHMLTFIDYLDAHEIDVTKTSELDRILKTFKRTLQGQARLWIDGQTFRTFNDLRDIFIRRFSPAKSSYGHIREFNSMTKTDGESADAFLQRLRQAAFASTTATNKYGRNSWTPSPMTASQPSLGQPVINVLESAAMLMIGNPGT